MNDTAYPDTTKRVYTVEMADKFAEEIVAENWVTQDCGALWFFNGSITDPVTVDLLAPGTWRRMRDKA